MASIVVALQHEFYIRGVAANVHILTPDCLYELREGPHANAPRVTRILARDDLVGPHPFRLVGDGPEV